MANVYAVSAGNWSTPARWNTGSLPTSADDVYANGFAVTIDQDITVLSIQTRSATGIAAGGSFTASTSRTINAKVYAGTSTCLTLSGTSLTFNINATDVQGGNTSTSANGITVNANTSNVNITSTNVTGGSGSTATNSYGIICQGASNVYVINATNVTGGSNSGVSNYGIYFNMTSGSHSVTLNSTTITGGSTNGVNYAISFGNSVGLTYNITGNCVASNAASSINISSSATTTINWIGNITGGTGGSSVFGVTATGTLWTWNLTGDITGGSGGTNPHGFYHNSSNGVLNVTGNAIGGSVAYGVYNNTTGTVRVRTAQGSTAYPGLYGNITTGVTTFEQAIFGSTGAVPFNGFCKLKAGSNNYITCQKESGTLTLIDTANASAGYPSASDVRLGTTYNFGNTTGTLAVPLASQVSSGIAVDNTTGTAVITSANVKSAVWDAQTSTLTTSGSIGQRAANGATYQDVGDLITSLT